ncbi:PHB depolymerase family esterase [Caballeronia fortuita]|uniref:PHB depolymerase family esterase n=1 Tax=Caballeronia fortuita TaxID=1777138 RepID=UPI0007727F88|nr:PHB depolymerase family esterase [Caballeronia fortuita]
MAQANGAPGTGKQTWRAMTVMLHAAQQHPDDFAAGTQMNVAAEDVGFIVVYPQQPKRESAALRELVYTVASGARHRRNRAGRRPHE